MRLDDWRWSALARENDAAIECSMLLIALARQPNHSHADLSATFGPRHMIRIMTEMNSFCISARRAIERADVLKPGLKNEAKNLFPHKEKQKIRDMLGEFELTTGSFWWIISRIIHSVSVGVKDFTEFVSADQMHIHSIYYYRYFQFSSDLDKASVGPFGGIRAERAHIVDIERLVLLYSYFARAIDELLKPTAR